MKIAVIDDYQDAFRKTQCARKLSAHEIVTYTSSEKDPVKFGARAEGCEAIVLTQQRSFLPRAFVQALPASVKLLAQTGRGAAHIDLAACTERGIIVSASGGGEVAGANRARRGAHRSRGVHRARHHRFRQRRR